jgi:ATP-dependent helicase/nuclease subunit A
MSGTAAEREAARASDPGVSAWVSANAGAGKTHLLANRVTRLLLQGVKPERILCLTYTKAAASEMSRRLFDRLGKWALLPERELSKALSDIGAGPHGAEDLKTARRLFAQALETPGGLKIQTLHSFCQHVLTRFPIEAGVAPGFQVLEERSAAELMRRARNSVLERAAVGEEPLAKAVTLLATRAPDKRFGETVDLAIGQTRGKLRAVMARHRDDPSVFSARLRSHLGVAPGVEESHVTEEFCARLKGERGDCERVMRWLLAGSATDRDLGESLQRFLERDMAAEAWEDLAALFLKKDHEPRERLATKKSRDAQPALDTYLTMLAADFLPVEEMRRAAATAELTEAIVTVAMGVLEEYDRLKRARAGLDYDDLIARTLALLDKKDAAAWVLYKLDGGLDHILVDEAQDTSPEQWRIVTKLVEEFFAGRGVRDDGARPRTIFAVGDEKQSIFSFQGAAPEEFGRNLTAFRARAEDARLAFEDVPLAASRRSARAILEFVDAVFANPAAHAGLTAAGGPPRHEPHRTEIGRVELWPLVQAPAKAPVDHLAPVDAPPETGAHADLAALIAKRVKRWLDSGTTLLGRERPLRAGDIMILVRRRGPFAQEMIRQLRVQEVAVAGADRMALNEQIAIADLVALGRFVLLPEDDLTLAALLKSPLVDLNETELFDLAYGRAGSLWTALDARHGENPRFGRAHAFLADSLSRADYAAPFEFYARILSLGGRAALTARLGDEAADAIDEFLALALAHERAHPPSLQGFLDWFSRGADEIKRDMDETGGAVRVMTVHGAKGLEADIVIVPDTTQIPNKEASAGLLYTEDFVFFGMPKGMDTTAVRQAKDDAHAREMREYRRLLYVALTRARERLIVCGYTMANGRISAESWYPLIADAVKANGRVEILEDGDEILAWGEDNAPTQGAMRGSVEKKESNLPDFLREPAAPEPLRPRILRPSEAAGDDMGFPPPVISPFSDAGAVRFARGLHLHALLAALPEFAPERQQEVARAYGARNGLSAEESDVLTREALAVLRDPDFAPLFTAQSRGEVSIVAELPELGPGIRVSGQIDRLAVSDTTVMVADFKTNRPPPKTESETPSLYRAQMALYRAALSKLYPQHRIVCALIWTEGPRLMTLSESLLDAELAKITSRFVG